jgi:hypothetical protein
LHTPHLPAEFSRKGGGRELSGSQRQVADLPGDAMRQVFLGTIVPGDESRAMHYGRDQERDVVGFVERIGTDRQGC